MANHTQLFDDDAQYRRTVAYLETLEDSPELVYIEGAGGDPSRWTYRRFVSTSEGNFAWGNADCIPYHHSYINPFFPAPGYYNVRDRVFWYSRTAKRQWKKSFQTSVERNGGVELYGLPCPPQRLREEVDYSLLCEPTFIHSLANPVYPAQADVLQIEKDMLSGVINQIALCRLVAVSTLVLGKPPIVFYRGVVAGHLEGGKIHLTPYTTFLKDDIEQYVEVVCNV